ncbi:MAG: hypothetical protein ABSE62_02145 [Chthoniobacteraceae bacterium]|jgi:hypothetical protein
MKTLLRTGLALAATLMIGACARYSPSSVPLSSHGPSTTTSGSTIFVHTY